MKIKKQHNLIYLAVPYSHPSEEVRAKRHDLVTKATAKLFEAGHHVYSPITHSHAMQEHLSEQATTFETWSAFDLNILNRCEELWVLTLNGWDDSVGVQAEIQYARDRNKLIRYLLADDKCDFIVFKDSLGVE